MTKAGRHLASKTYSPKIPKEREFRYRAIQWIFRLLFRLILRVKIEGLEKLPREGPLILVSNHLHLFDAPLIFCYLPARGTVMVAEKWETHPLFGPLFRSVNAVFINRGAADRAALRKVQSLLEQGAIVGIAPEGTRSKTGGLQQGEGGAALLAAKTSARLIPIACYGHEKWWKELRRLRRAEAVIRFGDPFTVPPLKGPNRSQQIDDMTTDIMVRLASLLPPEYRGVYRALVSNGPNVAVQAGEHEREPIS